MKGKGLMVFFFSCFLMLNAASQVPTPTEQQIENLTDQLEADIEDDQLLQQLDYLQKSPLNLNTITADELRQLRIITDLQIQNLLQYRKLFGALLSIYELQAVPTWDIITIRRVLPFITVSDPTSLAESLGQRFRGGEQYILLRNTRVLERSRGYNKNLTSFYPGSPDHLLLRYKYQYKNLLQYGITADKDAGEQFFGGAQSTGFDFYSAHFFVRRLGIIKALAIGDYNVNLGQGLIQWNSLAFKKSADVINIKRQSPTLLPYSSGAEVNFNRGAGITLEKGGWEATVFAAATPISGNTGVDTLTNEEIFYSFLTSGFHRTASEREDRYSITQTSLGSNIKYSNPYFSIGLNSINYHFSNPLKRRSEPYNQFAVNGDNWSNHSIDYSLTYRSLHLFGEAAIDKRGGKALTTGALVAVDPKVDVSLLYRNIGADYAAVYGDAFTESVSPQNEHGFYTGISIRPATGWRIDGYADIYRASFIRFRTDAPSTGKDYLVQLTYQPNKRAEIYARYRAETKERNESDTDSVLNFLAAKPRQNWRLHIQYAVSPSLTIKTRTEVVQYDKDGRDEETGYLAYVEGAYKGGFTWGGNLRLQYFETDGYDSRLYAFESDVLYGYSIPPSFDKGFRYYVNMHYDITKKLTLWARWAQTIYKDKTTVGSGLDEIQGNQRSEIKLQLRYIL